MLQQEITGRAVVHRKRITTDCPWAWLAGSWLASQDGRKTQAVVRLSLNLTVC